MASTLSSDQKQLREAEELLETLPQRIGFAKALYFGEFLGEAMFPYPEPSPEERAAGDQAVADLRAFMDEHVDPAEIDREADIAPEVIRGLGRIGVLGATIPREYGGRGLSQHNYCRMLEVIGARCGSTAVFVNAHHSIGLRAIVLFGTEEQKRRFLPALSSGETLAAFALTEPEAGSDAGNVQTRAEPTADGEAFLLNGQKRYITNGAIAQVLTVMARTPVPSSPTPVLGEGRGEGDAGKQTKVTAFLVTPDMPGFEVVEARMAKCGIRGTVTSRLAFHDMRVPRENVLGELGRGLKIALTVLDFGRTTFGASCTGAAKFCIEAAARHAQTRVQFGQPIAEFELVKKKLANMAALSAAMEAMTYYTAWLIDSGAEDFMAETAMLKVFASEALWQIVNDTIQIYGGQAYFTNEPYERMMRDARINMIGEGANDVLRTFIALVGLREVGGQLQKVLSAMKRPLGNLGLLSRFAGRRAGRMFRSLHVPVRHAALRGHGRHLAMLVKRFGVEVERVLRRYRQAVVYRQYAQERLADSAMELLAGSCLLAKLDGRLQREGASSREMQRALAVASYYLSSSARRIEQQLDALWFNNDRQTTSAAEAVLGGDSTAS